MIRTRSYVVIWLICISCTAPSAVFSDTFDKDLIHNLDSDAYLGVHEPTFATSGGWSSDLGFGYSMPQNGSVLFPGFNWVLITGSSILIIDSNPIQKPLKNSYSIEASVSKRASESMSYGLEMSYAIGHGIDISRAEVEQSANFVAFATQNPTFNYSVDYSMNIFEATPFVKMGPGLMSNESGWKPYFLFGAGGYFVSQNAHITMDGFAFNVFSRETTYLGATGGGGLAWKNDHFSAGAEVRYQTIFNPGSRLKFLIPTGRISYAF